MEHEFNELYNLHYEMLCRVAYKIVRDTEKAREVVQDVFFEFWKKRDKWAAIQSIKAYLITATYNRSLNCLRNNKVFSELGEDTQVDVNHGENNIDFQELMECIATGIAKLPPKCKEIFLLSREADLTYNEIANQLNISIKTVEKQMGIALKRLKAHLEHHTKLPDKIIFLFL